jgi:acetate kinase
MILVLNCGSQSLKWKLFDENLRLSEQGGADIFDSENYEKIIEKEILKIKNKDKISAIGHRVVHGAGIFTKPLKITEDSLKKLEKFNYLAPLHNPYSILGIKACNNIFKDIAQTAVFDTEFFSDLPKKAVTYGLPENIVKEFNFRRFGFHGISHEYSAKKAAEKIKKPFNKLKIITCHLGGGSSITAIRNGKAIDTSMGFTPQEGLIMMTRPGNIDAGIILELVKKYGADKTTDILNKESGLKGICGRNNMIKILEMVKLNNEKAKLALDVFVYSAQKYIGAYYAILGGCDILVFTGSIGSGNKITRNTICKGLPIIKKVKILAIEANEELAIAQKII